MELPPYDVRGERVGIVPDETIDPHVFGGGHSLADTPRAVTYLGKTLLDESGIHTFERLATLVPNLQMPASFGHAATPNLRGDLTEILTNGQRRTANAFGFKPSFNALEDLVVVRGPAPVVVGPGFYSGGYLNFLTKTPDTSDDFASVAWELGTWSPSTHSWTTTRVQWDQNHVLSHSTAMRLSVEGQRDETWYRANGGRDDATDIYLALRRIFPAGHWIFILQHQWQAAPETVGVNRVTQELLTNRLYRRGTVVDPRDFTVMPSGPTVPWERRNTVMSRGDFSNADVYFAQSLLSLRVAEGDLTNSTFFEAVNRRRYNQWEYSEYADQLTYENRTAWSRKTADGNTVFGATARYEWRRAYTNYTNIFFNAFDILDGTHRYSAPMEFPAAIVPGWPGPGGRLYFGPTNGVPETSESTLWNAAGFAEWMWRWGAFEILGGARGDYYGVGAHDPLLGAVRDQAQFGAGSANMSLLWHPATQWTAFATANRTSAVNASVSGEAITLDPYDRFRIAAANFHSTSDLFELGVRNVAPDRQVSVVGFWQFRQQNNFYTNAPSDIAVRGIEAEATWTGRRLYAASNVTFAEGNYRNSWPFEYPGLGASTVAAPGNYRMPGLSRWYANATVGGRVASAWHVQVQLRTQSRQTGDLTAELSIPGQYSVDASLAYRRPGLAVQLMVMNLTDQRNWVHNGDPYADNLFVGEELPLRAVLRMTRSFR